MSRSSSTSTRSRSFFGGVVGLVLALVLAPRRAAMPLVLLAHRRRDVRAGRRRRAVGDRPLPARAVADGDGLRRGLVAGWTMLREGTRLRRLWAVGAAALVVFGVVFTATSVNFTTFDNELRFRGDSHAALEQVLRDPAVAPALRCGPVSVPNHKLIPDVRWVLDARSDGVIARSDRADVERAAQRGVAIFVHHAHRAVRQALVEDDRRPGRQPSAGRLHPRRDQPALRRLCPLLEPARRERRPRATTATAAATCRWRRCRRPPTRPSGVVGAGGRRAARVRLRPARVGRRPRPALRLQRRRERALRPARDRAVRPRLEPALLRQPARLHVPRCTSCSACGSAAARASRRPSPPTRPRSGSSRA